MKGTGREGQDTATPGQSEEKKKKKIPQKEKKKQKKQKQLATQTMIAFLDIYLLAHLHTCLFGIDA